MFNEKDMEDAISNNPKKYLGEDGLVLIERQYPIGGYIFDLLFKDRHGGKLIVEIQKGTLDRPHTYKILDYYDEFRERNPKSFIELMVIANRIPEERKKRLRSWGVEFREIPDSEFTTEMPDTEIEKRTEKHVRSVVLPIQMIKPISENCNDSAYKLFKEQKNLLVAGLIRIAKDVTPKVNWIDLNQKDIGNHKNWHIGIVPNSWGVFKTGWYGVHFGFLSYREKKTDAEFIRFSVGVEKPLKPQYRDSFKKDVIEALRKRNVALPPDWDIWPNAGHQKGTKLAEYKLVSLNNTTWQILIDEYLKMGGFIQVVADVIKQYYKIDGFTVHLDFPSTPPE